MPETWTAVLVVLVIRYTWDSVGPRATTPKSCDNPLNRPSAHEVACAGVAIINAIKADKLSRAITAEPQGCGFIDVDVVCSMNYARAPVRRSNVADRENRAGIHTTSADPLSFCESENPQPVRG
jgi:hypothetical protein